MSVCLICLKDKGNSRGAKKYCSSCMTEIDRRHAVLWAKTKSEIYTLIVRDMILESAARIKEENQPQPATAQVPPCQHDYYPKEGIGVKRCIHCNSSFVG
jgi:ribosomal protein L37AE/L43A